MQPCGQVAPGRNLLGVVDTSAHIDLVDDGSGDEAVTTHLQPLKHSGVKDERRLIFNDHHPAYGTQVIVLAAVAPTANQHGPECTVLTNSSTKIECKRRLLRPGDLLPGKRDTPPVVLIGFRRKSIEEIVIATEARESDKIPSQLHQNASKLFGLFDQSNATQSRRLPGVGQREPPQQPSARLSELLSDWPKVPSKRIPISERRKRSKIARAQSANGSEPAVILGKSESHLESPVLFGTAHSAKRGT